MLATLPSVAIHAQTASRNVSYHSQDIVPIRAKVKYTTLIVIPATEKIMEAATGDEDFWIVDVVGNFRFVHPAKPGISSDARSYNSLPPQFLQACSPRSIKLVLQTRGRQVRLSCPLFALARTATILSALFLMALPRSKFPPGTVAETFSP